MEELVEFEFNEFLIMVGNFVGIVLIGIIFVLFMYLSYKIDLDVIVKKILFFYNFFFNKWYLDNINDFLFVKGSCCLVW